MTASLLRSRSSFMTFYKEYEDTQTFEKAIISLMLETEGTHFSILLNSLKREIENNISMYNTCREFFDRLDIEHICRQHERCHDRDIERQMQITNEYYRELMEANGSLEAVGFREHDRQEEERLEKRYGQCKREYDREKAKLDELYAQKEQARREAPTIPEKPLRRHIQAGRIAAGNPRKIHDRPKEKRKGKKKRPPHRPHTHLFSHETLVSRLRKNVTVNSSKPFPNWTFTPA